MVIDKEFLQKEVTAAERAVNAHHEQLLHARGCLAMLQQLLKIAEQPEPEASASE